jgi:alpha-tubulin suppressor-like RCC1 family protein
VSLGADHSLFLSDKGLVFASGSSERGQLGDPYYHHQKYTDPFVIHDTFENSYNKCVKVKAGDGFSVLLTEQGDVYTFGNANYGRLGHEHRVSLSKPSMVEYFSKNKIKIKKIAIGGRHTFAISEQNAIYAWGFGFYYQLGTGKQNDCYVPTKIFFDKQVKNISCGYFHTAVIFD